MPTTEIATVPLVAGSKPGDPSDPSAAILKETFNTLQQQDGMQQIHFGLLEENPDVLQMMINWDSKRKHEDFMGSEAYGPFMSRIGAVVAGPPTIVHADFKPEGVITKVFSAPVTEVATFTYSGEVESDWESSVKQADEWIASAEGSLGMAWGTTYEEVEEKGVKGKAVVVMIGWQSVQHHMDFRAKPEFKEKVGMLRGQSQAVEMHHVAMMQAL